MDMSQYQKMAMMTAIYPDSGELAGVSYAILGLVGETGELANMFKKVLRGDDGKTKESFAEAAKSELGDVLWYIAAICKELDLDLSDIAHSNVVKLAARSIAGTIQGDGEGTREQWRLSTKVKNEYLSFDGSKEKCYDILRKYGLRLAEDMSDDLKYYNVAPQNAGPYPAISDFVGCMFKIPDAEITQEVAVIDESMVEND